MGVLAASGVVGKAIIELTLPTSAAERAPQREDSSEIWHRRQPFEGGAVYVPRTSSAAGRNPMTN